jgi:hypothetical protein
MTLSSLENDDFKLPEAQFQLQYDYDLLGNQKADKSASSEVTLLSKSLGPNAGESIEEKT